MSYNVQEYEMKTQVFQSGNFSEIERFAYILNKNPRGYICQLPIDFVKFHLHI